MCILILLAVTFTLFIIIDYILNEAKKKYNNVRVGLIETISTISSEVCTCNNTCFCKDMYIRVMEEQGVDLVLK